MSVVTVTGERANGQQVRGGEGKCKGPVRLREKLALLVIFLVGFLS